METLNPIEQSYRRLRASGRSILKLYSGNPNEQGFRFPPEALTRIYNRYFQSQEYRPHPKGLEVARRAISAYYSGFGAEVDPEHLLLTSGTSESFFYLFSLLAGPGDNLLTPNPAYPLFDSIAGLARVNLRHYRLREDRDWRLDLDDLKAKADAHTRAVVLVSPNNPTGAVHGSEEIEGLVAWANDRNLPLICDEVFSEFYFGTNPFPRPMVLTKPQLCFTLNGLSKMLALPGLKLSWIAVTGEPDRVETAVDRLETMADTFLSCHIPIQEALPTLFTEGQDFVREYRREVQRRRDLAVTILRTSTDLRCIEPAGGFYLTVEVTKPLPFDEETLVIRLMEQENIFVHPGFFYDYETGIHLILSFLTEPEKLRSGLEALLRFIHRV